MSSDTLQHDPAAVLNSITDPIWAVDHDYRLFYWNQTFVTFFRQWSTTDVPVSAGLMLLQHLPHDLALRLQHLYARAFHGETVTEQLTRALASIELSLSPISDTTQAVIGVTAVARNMASRIYAEEALLRLNQTLQRRVEELSVLYRIAQVTVNIGGMQSILNRIVLEVTDIFGARGTLVVLFDAFAAQLSVMALYDIDPDAPDIGDLIVPIDRVPIVKRLMETPVPLVVNMGLHAQLLGPFANVARRSGLVSLLLVPLRMRGTVIGCLVITSDRAGDAFLDLEVRLAETIAGQIASAVEHGRLLEEARHAQIAAESANIAKSRFLAAMSHELRTPLNGLLGFTQIMLLDPRLQPAQREDVRLIQQSGEHLLTLINDILDLARIEAGITDLTLEWCSLPDLLNGIANMIRVWAQQKGIGFAFHATQSPELPLPDQIWCDSRRLRQILLNLLGNAIKFTADGQVTLVVERLPHVSPGKPDEQTLRFRVEDTGIGIAAEDLERVFEPFQQAGAPGQRAAGSGLGLAISRELAALMGSRILLESTPGKGSTFWLDLTVATRMVSVAERTVFEQIEQVPVQLSLVELCPSEVLAEFRHLVQIGDIRAIRGRAEQLIETHPQARPFAEEVITLVRGFQLPRLRALLDPPPAG